MENYLPWCILFAHITILLCIDFFVLHRKNSTVINTRRIALETVFFVSNALLFSGIIYWLYKSGLAANPNEISANEGVIKYITGYLIELSLSVDNLFVMAVILTRYKIPYQYQHKLLFLGILGAIVFRALLIGLGLVLIKNIQGINIIFGLFLLYTALKMFKKEDDSQEEGQSKLTRFFNISNKLDEGKFRTEINGKMVFTALFGALITIEVTDLLFAFDSIPAILAITSDPFIVFSSNIFAIMGLRSMYFFLAKMLEKFEYLKYSVFVILVFVSIKLIGASFFHISEGISLLIIGLALGAGIWVSVSRLNKSG